MKKFQKKSGRYYELDQYEGVAGVYVLRTARGLYVGSSVNLRDRLRRWAWQLPNCEYRAIPAINLLEKEQLLIAKLQSSGHRVLNMRDAIRQREIPCPRPPPLRTQNALCLPRMITALGRTQTLSQWCAEMNIEKSLFYARLRTGWGEARAASTPKEHGKAVKHAGRRRK